MKDLFDFLRKPPVTEINTYGDLFGLILMPFWLFAWVAVIGVGLAAITTIVNDPTGTGIIVASGIGAILAIRWIVYPIGKHIYDKRENERWERERPEREAAEARYEESQKRIKWEKFRIEEIKEEMIDICIHPSTQRMSLGSFNSFLWEHPEGVQCVACNAFWEGKSMAPPHHGRDMFDYLPPEMIEKYQMMQRREGQPNPKLDFVGPTIPDWKMDLHGKVMRNHTSCHTNLEHYEMLLQEIKDGNYYYNLEDVPKLEYLEHLSLRTRDTTKPPKRVKIEPCEIDFNFSDPDNI